MVNGEDEFGWGAVVNFQKKANQSKVRINLRFQCFVKNLTTVPRNLCKLLLPNHNIVYNDRLLVLFPHLGAELVSWLAAYLSIA